MSYPGFQDYILENDGSGPYIDPARIRSTGSFIPGEIRLMPFPPNELPEPWWFCNGEKLTLSSPEGQVLYNLSPTFKACWGIVLSSGNTLISLPDWYDDDGNGYFPRAIDGVSRQVGSIQGDAIRNITGSIVGTASNYGAFLMINYSATGALSTGVRSGYGAVVANTNLTHDLFFDASAAPDVQVANENRPINIGLTAAICLPI
jgi:microcystin-dependent protein